MRIRAKVRLWLALLGVWALFPGCSTPPFSRTIYVPSGKSVRLRETVKSAKVWVLDASGKPVPGVMDLPEGWFALPDPGEKKDGTR
jgi:hypothetical protein